MEGLHFQSWEPSMCLADRLRLPPRISAICCHPCGAISGDGKLFNANRRDRASNPRSLVGKTIREEFDDSQRLVSFRSCRSGSFVVVDPVYPSSLFGGFGMMFCGSWCFLRIVRPRCQDTKGRQGPAEADRGPHLPRVCRSDGTEEVQQNPWTECPRNREGMV